MQRDIRHLVQSDLLNSGQVAPWVAVGHRGLEPRRSLLQGVVGDGRVGRGDVGRLKSRT